jgi:hypothetical protein
MAASRSSPGAFWNVQGYHRTTLCALLYSYSQYLCVLIGEMDSKRENPGMWINPKSNFTGGDHSSEYGEGQSTHNSRFLELADVVLSKDKPAKPKAKAVAAGQDPQR